MLAQEGKRLMKALLITLITFVAGCVTAEPVDIGEPLVEPETWAIDEPQPQAVAPSVVTVPCEAQQGGYWAAASFPGATAEELFGVRAVARNGSTFYPFFGFDFEQVPVFIADEQVVASCELSAGGADQVTFLR
jgi:hypothetical protein